MGRYLLCVALPMVTLSCGGEPVCECAAQGITIAIPPALAPTVTAVAVSERACDGLVPACTAKDAQGNCTSYHVSPTTYGNCHVVVTLQGRTYVSDVRVVQKSGCCSGYFADPLAAGTVEVSRYGGLGP